MDKFSTDKQLAERFDVSRATIWRWTRLGDFPPPVKLGARATRWSGSDVEAWLARRGRPATGSAAGR